MGQRKVSLEILDRLVHYSLALIFGLPILCFVGYFLLGRFELFGISPSIDIWVVILPGIILAPISLLFYFIQHDKLRFQFLRTATEIEDSKKLIRDIAREQKWAIRSFKDNVFTIKTNPGFVNQSWGQHITIQVVNGGLLVNSIFDPNKGSWSITFNSNQKNIEQIRKLILDRATGGEMTGDSKKNI